MNRAVPFSPSPTSVVNTGVSDQKAPCDKPTPAQATNARGEIRQSCISRSGADGPIVGGVELAREIGTAAIEISIDVTTNKTKLFASAVSNSSCPSPKAPRFTIMYTAKMRPRVSCVDFSFSQLSIVM